MDLISFTLLGTGSSGGVPRVGNQWGMCDPSNEKNRRRRCAMLVRKTNSSDAQTTLLIDAGADLREQLLSAEVSNLDAVLLSHPHADHIFGLDDLRQLALSLRRSIDVHMDEYTSSIVMRSFSYCFYQAPDSSYPAFCTEKRIVPNQPIHVTGAAGCVQVQALMVEHGDIDALGFRIHDLVYIPDIKRIKDKRAWDLLNDVSVLIIDALRHRTHPAHMNLNEALELIKTIAPQRAILTNMHSDLDFETLANTLPDGVEPGYDGLTVNCSITP